MNDSDFMRYSRQLLLEDIAIDGQQALLSSRVLIIGLGGLGSPAAFYLAGGGVGMIMLADNDNVHLSDLQRQILFTTRDIAQPKVQIAAQRLKNLNPMIELVVFEQYLTDNKLKKVITQADVVLDCTDNVVTRQAINAACVTLNKPLITAGAIGLNGQLATLTPPWSKGCYHCLWPDNEEPKSNCRTSGILGPVVGIMGAMQALEAIKLLSGMETPRNLLHLFDAKNGNWHHLELQKANNCLVCGGGKSIENLC